MMIQAIQSAAPFRALCVALAAAGLKSKNSRSSDWSMLFRQMGDGTAAFRRRMAPPATSQRIPEHFCTVQPRSIPKGVLSCRLKHPRSRASGFPWSRCSRAAPPMAARCAGLVRHYAAAGVDGLVVRQHRRRGAGRRRAAGRAGRGAERRRRPARDDGPGRQPPGSCAAPPVGLRHAAAGGHPGARAVLRAARTGRRVRLFPLPGRRLALALYDIPYRTGAALDTATLLELAARGTSPPSGLRRLAGKDRGADRRWPAASVGGRGFADAVDLVPGWFRHHRGRRAHPASTCSWRCTAPCEQRLDQARALFLALAPMIQLAFAGQSRTRQGAAGAAGPADRRAARAHAGGQRRWRTACRRRWPSWTVRFRRVERGAGACRPRADGASGRLCPLRIHLVIHASPDADGLLMMRPFSG